MTKQLCDNCRWWRELAPNEGTGKCHVNPPQLTLFGWCNPETDRQSFCSAWTGQADVQDTTTAVRGMRDDTWHPAASPPLAHRLVMLRFNTTGDLDCRGHYCEGSFFLEGREPARYRVCLPTHWRHLKMDDMR